MRLAIPAMSLGLLVLPTLATAETRQVGPAATFATPCAAFAAAQDGDTVEIAAGTYTDMCAIERSGLTIRGTGERPVIDGQGSSAQRKAIWIISGQNTTVENVEFVNAAAPDRNGAGIRMQGKNLTIRNSAFRNNENGILESNVADSEIVVERCEFDSNGDGDKGQAHNMYIGRVRRFVLRESWSHGAKIGHLVKTRAAENVIEYNRLTGDGGTQSYELELTMGGKAWVVGNVIEQGPTTDNPAMLAYGQEGLAAGENFLYVAHNTFVNHRPGGGTFVVVAERFQGEVKLVNNLFAGPGTVTNYAGATQQGSCTTPPTFVDEAGFDFHLAPGSACLDTGVAAGSGGGLSLTPTRQYVHPRSSEGRVAVNAPDPGAFELGGAVPDGASSSSGGGGASSSSSGAAASGGTPGASSSSGASASGGNGNGSSDAASGDESGEESGCSTSPGTTRGAAMLWLAALALLVRRSCRRAGDA